MVSLLLSFCLLAAMVTMTLLVFGWSARQRRLIEAERRLARASVEEQTLARLEAEQSEAVNRQLLQLLGQELRGPLTSIRGFARELHERGAALSSGEQEEFFAIIRRQSHRLTRVIEDLMLSARLASGDATTSHFVPVDIASLVRDVVDEIDAGPRGRVVAIASGEVPRVRGDATEFRQALFSLIENAGRYSPEGGTIEVVVFLAGTRVEVSVREDSPQGVPVDDLEGIFELMTTGEGPPGGLGLSVGMHLARQVAARVGGEIRFDLDSEHGSVMVLSLPAIPDDAEAFVLTDDADVGTIDSR